MPHWSSPIKLAQRWQQKMKNHPKNYSNLDSSSGNSTFPSKKIFLCNVFRLIIFSFSYHISTLHFFNLYSFDQDFIKDAHRFKVKVDFSFFFCLFVRSLPCKPSLNFFCFVFLCLCTFHVFYQLISLYFGVSFETGFNDLMESPAKDLGKFKICLDKLI